jgi:hypothetical protein
MKPSGAEDAGGVEFARPVGPDRDRAAAEEAQAVSP